ncbi:MAG: hypothetical protein JNL21_16720 [Myxococcales bacterium]|nr:hypothetical protein [Myxococcales bacterium]
MLSSIVSMHGVDLTTDGGTRRSSKLGSRATLARKQLRGLSLRATGGRAEIIGRAERSILGFALVALSTACDSTVLLQPSSVGDGGSGATAVGGAADATSASTGSGIPGLQQLTVRVRTMRDEARPGLVVLSHDAAGKLIDRELTGTEPVIVATSTGGTVSILDEDAGGIPVWESFRVVHALRAIDIRRGWGVGPPMTMQLSLPADGASYRAYAACGEEASGSVIHLVSDQSTFPIYGCPGGETFDLVVLRRDEQLHVSGFAIVADVVFRAGSSVEYEVAVFSDALDDVRFEVVEEEPGRSDGPPVFTHLPSGTPVKCRDAGLRCSVLPFGVLHATQPLIDDDGERTCPFATRFATRRWTLPIESPAAWPVPVLARPRIQGSPTQPSWSLLDDGQVGSVVTLSQLWDSDAADDVVVPVLYRWLHDDPTAGQGDLGQPEVPPDLVARFVPSPPAWASVDVWHKSVGSTTYALAAETLDRYGYQYAVSSHTCD